MIRRTRPNAFSALCGLLAAGLIAAPLVAVPSGSLTAAPVAIASDLTGAAPVNLVSFTDDPAIPFTSAGDGFNVFQRGVSPTIPFDLLDDSLVVPGRHAGHHRRNDLDPFFGVVDTRQRRHAGPGHRDVGVRHQRCERPRLSHRHRRDGRLRGARTPSIGATRSTPAHPAVLARCRRGRVAHYTMAGGAVVTLNDPIELGAVELSNVLQPVTPARRPGSQLTLTLTADTDGGGEAVVFQNIVITATTAARRSDPGDLVITEVMQNPSAVGDGDGEWFEIQNVSGSDIDIDGWTISDRDSDSHVIATAAAHRAGRRLRRARQQRRHGHQRRRRRSTTLRPVWFLSNSADEVSSPTRTPSSSTASSTTADRSGPTPPVRR